MKHASTIFTITLLLLLGYLLRPQSNPVYFSRLASLPQVNSVYSGIGYISKDSTKYDIALLNSELSYPSQLIFTPDAKFLLVMQETGELLAFRRSSPTEFYSNPNLVTTLDQKVDSVAVDSTHIYLTSGNLTYDISTKMQNNLLIPISKSLVSSIKTSLHTQLVDISSLVTRSSASQKFLSKPTSGVKDPISNHIFFADTLEGRLYEIKPQP